MRYLYICFIVIILSACEAGSNESTASTNQKEDTKLSKVAPSETFMDTVALYSQDGLEMEGYLYQVTADAPVVLLCHQANFNKHEYDEIAVRLNENGYNCLAIDQRSGGPLDGYENTTYLRAVDQGLPTTYVEAEQDIITGIEFLVKRYKKPVILWGSSYSAGLALHLGQQNEDVQAVIAFSPGDYFNGERPELIEVMPNYEKPFFITSSKKEAEKLAKILKNVHSDERHKHFMPKNDGKHGSKALWKSHKNNEEYWTAVLQFLTAVCK